METPINEQIARVVAYVIFVGIPIVLMIYSFIVGRIDKEQRQQEIDNEPFD